MIDSAETLSPALRAGLRAVVGMKSCRVGQPIAFTQTWPRWVLPTVFSIDHPSRFVSATTTCYALVSKDYPFGRIEVCPAKDGGPDGIFPHQLKATNAPPLLPWRLDRLCLEEPFGQRRATRPSDPIGDAESRLRWYIERAAQWLAAAAQGKLVLPGAPFELPLFRGLFSPRIVFDESKASFHNWTESRSAFGRLWCEPLADAANVLIVRQFENITGDQVIHAWKDSETSIGTAPANSIPGFWWLWPRPIVIEPWTTPSTWGDLRLIGRNLGVDVDSVLRKIATYIRGRGRFHLLLGFPIPLRESEDASEITWQAVDLPELTLGTPQPGFRPNEMGWWYRDRRAKLGDTQHMNYFSTENWHPDRLQARGRLPEKVRGTQIALIGIGALGGAIVDMLVRTGCSRLLIIDGDSLTAGNVTRHVLTLQSLGVKKVDAMKKHLELINPQAEIRVVAEELPTSVEEVHDLLEESDIVIDCSATNGVPILLGNTWWSVPRLFFSFSVGFRAQRLFAFSHLGNQFANIQFQTQLDTWLSVEQQKWNDEPELLEGAGCWSPLFPARLDDISAAASACVKIIESTVKRPPTDPALVVFEHRYEHNTYVGFCRCDDKREIILGEVA